MNNKSKQHAASYNLLSKNQPLPPVGQASKTYMLPSSFEKTDLPSVETAKSKPAEALINKKMRWSLSSSHSSKGHHSTSPKALDDVDTLEQLLQKQLQSPFSKLDKENKGDIQARRPTETHAQLEPCKRRDVSESETITPLMQTTSSVSSALKSIPDETASNKDLHKMGNLKDGHPRLPSSSKYGLDRKQSILLESLSSQEARGLLRQASLERLGSSKIPSFVTSASKSNRSQAGFPLNNPEERMRTPESRLVSVPSNYCIRRCYMS